ncbi:MAG: GYDIA family GHMP kinase [Dysgonamonadaceae bacterium]|nr:GYDIA family GHMP kinase [Dysgonamonadaceae bacterium]MDD4728953.1 GYDIA family GHMP kinase [Dysgonamonadaceae bacterium]
MKKFHANGKLLITGEYLVLKGALALAAPLNKGQTLSVTQSKKSGLSWRAEIPNGLWFEVQFDEHLTIVESTDRKKAENLQLIFRKAAEQNLSVQKKLNHNTVTTHLEFDPSWGWGSSSTLLHLLEQWLEIDPYQLMDATIGGSGYDIACADANQPIFYQRTKGGSPQITTAPFNPTFIQQMGIVYLNKKQNSSSQVKSFLKSAAPNKELIDKISDLSKEFTIVQEIHKFMRLMQQHEKIIATAIGLTPVQKLLFPDYVGAIKSLGAWGGDFALFLSANDFATNKKWFQSKGYPVVMPFEEVIINK